MFLQSVNTAALEKAASAVWQRTQLINTNIVNQDTPGYKAKRLDFESALQSELDNVGGAKKVSRKQAVERVQQIMPTVYDQTGNIMRADGNNVDILEEQSELVRNQYFYQALTQKISGYYANLKYAISGGR